MQWQIYWTPKTKLYELQGAVIDFVKENEVHYQNHFLPSGRVIASWSDEANYFQEKRIGQLPKLRPGKRYRAKFSVANSDKMRAYLSWRFFDEQGQEIAQHYQNGQEDVFTLPEKTFSYRIDLLSAGSGDFTFHEIQLAPAVDGVLLDGDQAVTNHLTAYLQLPKTIVSKTLRVLITEPVLTTMAYPLERVQPSPQAVLYLATDLLHCQSYYDEQVLEVINQAKKAAKAKEVAFIGYGPISSLTALLYRRAVKGATAVIPKQEDLHLPAGYRRRSKGLADFIASLPKKIADLRSDEDAVLEKATLTTYPSDLRVATAADELLTGLPYLDWPVDKKVEKKRKAKAQAEKEAAEKAARLRLKEARKQKKAANQASEKPAKKAQPDKPDFVRDQNQDDALLRRKKRHGSRHRQIEKQEANSSSQRLQDFFTKSRSK
ncbi:accessory Sec system protein Asp3 [Fructobacillus parabroussonetiae]|uniref:Accessory Sec system protein Asp3 n=1 Tax=Fructobacillus parabroussonetiae TaxID=2713174 RepID=A0ABS5QWK4_9LACO|nr:accessory Sec system protein Asp3 [Fructobacillus parabroussonetiae]MBS9337584.1 accessory Sec system protein Asp3 [Fructobacillus parabroussonetiae]